MDAALATKVTLISAPAGYGKTTLVAAWAKHLLRAGLAHAAWVDCRAYDDLATFVDQLLTAIQATCATAAHSVATYLQAARLLPPTRLAEVLADAVEMAQWRLVIILDDYHRIFSPAAHDFVSHLVERSAEHLHFVLAARGNPPLPLTRWRARGQLIELRARDLAFTTEESSRFLQTYLERPVEQRVIEALQARTEGWAAGLSLAANALQKNGDPDRFIAAIQTSVQSAAEFLIDEVLTPLPVEMQDFLLKTALMDRFCAEVAAVTAGVSIPTAQRLLHQMRETDLFLIDIDGQGRWFRYQYQFQAMLTQRLQQQAAPVEIATYYHRAGDWYAARDMVEDGVRHLLLAGEGDRAAALIEAHVPRLLETEAYQTLAGWLEQLPHALTERRSGLMLARAWLHFMRLEYARAAEISNKANALLQNDTPELDEATRRAYKAECTILIGALDSQRALEDRLVDLEQGLTNLPGQRSQTRAFGLTFVAMHKQHLGQTSAAIRLLQDALESTQPRSSAADAQLLWALAMVFIHAGQLRDAQQIGVRLMDIATRFQRPISDLRARLIAGLVHYERHEYADAEPRLVAVMNQPYLVHRLSLMVSANALLDVYIEQRRWDEARRIVADLRDFILAQNNQQGLLDVDRLAARLALHTGDLPKALSWVERTRRAMPALPEDDTLLTGAEILIASGRAPLLREAEVILRGSVMRYQAIGHRILECRARILLALALAAQGEAVWGNHALAEALVLAAPLGLVRVFSTSGMTIIGLLRTLTRTDMHAHAAQAQAMLDQLVPPPPAPPTRVSRSPDAGTPTALLSFREQEVLELLAQRLSNKEIAAQLHLSPITVRNHTSNIYSKLQVASRVEAVHYARISGLLDRS